MVMDGLKTGDRPGALGMFILQGLYELTRDNDGVVPEVALTFGAVDAASLGEFSRKNQVYIPHLVGDEFANVYTVMQAVQRGDPRVL